MADVEVGLGAVVCDEDLTVLERVHGARVDVEVRVELLHGDAQATQLEKAPEARRRQPLAKTGGDAAGDEQMFGVCGAAQEGLPWSLQISRRTLMNGLKVHGLSEYQTVPAKCPNIPAPRAGET
ncbi:hypothetical protein GCM10010517_04600 [Streptosporangium fragile]|uniref:Uncharacterized protein n=1 Tax=Streptosporangium fragile TaxID=46186 RepID=A0ABP6I889_9ACTN